MTASGRKKLEKPLRVCDMFFVVIWLSIMKSFFGNVYELLALLCGSTELKQSISVPSEFVVTPSQCWK